MNYYDITKSRKNAIMQRTYEYYRNYINNIDWAKEGSMINALRTQCCKHCKKYKKNKHNFDNCTECLMFQMYLICLHREWQKYDEFSE